MAVLLGIDTGGTFTDAVVVTAEAPHRVLATAKRPTTHNNLSDGLGQALAAVLARAEVSTDDVALVSVSTTLATNALVEGQGDSVGVLALGFESRDLDRAGIGDVVASGDIVALKGGHDAHGYELEAIAEEQIKEAVRELAPRVSALAITGQFSVRNPAHELAAAAIAREVSLLPVTCSHELSSRLDGPRRALTAVLNARLLAIGSRLIAAIDQVIAEAAISAPLMIVRGDGSVVRSEYALDRPIETVFSGPAASVIGAQYLAGIDRGLIVDVGGTTTDISVIRDGGPRLASHGATVGGHRTMVAALESSTVGLGGDSEVHVDTRAADGPLQIGPARAIPIGRLARTSPSVVDALRSQLAEPVGLPSHGRFVVATAEPSGALDRREQMVLDRIVKGGPITEAEAAPSGLEGRALQRLRDRGIVRIATITPSDAWAMRGHGLDLDVEASTLAAEVVARQSGQKGKAIAESGASFASDVLLLLERRSAAFALQCALAADGLQVDQSDPLLLASIAQRDTDATVASVSIGARDPIVAIGAPARALYPEVAKLTGTEVVVPEHSEVANAIGAVVGRVQVRHSATITQPTKGQYKVHLDDQPAFGSVDNAYEWAKTELSERAMADAERAGAQAVELSEQWQVKQATVADKEVFVEGQLTVEAAGKPAW